MSQVSSSLGLVGMGAVLLSCTSVAWALGIGEVKSNSILGARLDVTIPVLGGAHEKTPPPVHCIKPVVEVGETQLSPRQIRLQLQPGRGGALYMIQLISEINIIEPVVSVSLSLGCESPLTRRFVLLIDPPGFVLDGRRLDGENADLASSTSAIDPQVDSSDLMSSPRLTASTQGRAPSAFNARGDIKLKKQRPKGSSDRRATASSRGGSRLSLEAPDMSAGALSGSAKNLEQTNSISTQIGLLGQLENMLKQISAENQSVRDSMEALKDKLKVTEMALQTERARQSAQPPIVWILCGVIGVMGLGLLALWLRPRRQPTPQFQVSSIFNPNVQPDWRDVPVLKSAAASVEPKEPVLMQEPRKAVVAEKPIEKETPPVLFEDEPVVSDLVDLDQQADFLIALGNEQAAIDLLSGHAKQDSSPLAYIKLMDIYQHRGEQMAYEQLRSRFHRRFNANIPPWGADPSVARGLEDYPVVRARLESSWSDSVATLKLLESLIMKRDGPGVKFELSAFRDLLMLNSVVKDLLEQSHRSTVLDVELPLSAAPGSAS